MFRKPTSKNAVKPEARTAELSITVSGDETLIYDRENFVIHRLNQETALVFGLADGSRDLTALASDANLPIATVEDALATLVSSGLVKAESVGTSIMNRRRLLGGAAGAAASVAFIGRAAASHHCIPASRTFLDVVNGVAVTVTVNCVECDNGECCGPATGSNGNDWGWTCV